MIKELKLAEKAYKNYNICDKSEEKILEYVKERINENKEEIISILKLYNKKEKFEDFLEVIEKVESVENRYKKELNLDKREDNFVHTIYTTSIGIIAYITESTLTSFEYMLKAIKSRNAVIIVDDKYNEKDDKHLLLYIIQESLSKFELDRELVQILPPEEVNFEKMDKTVDGKKVTAKERENKSYIYIEDGDFEEEARKDYEKFRNNEVVEILTRKFDDVIEKINEKYCKCAVIYTKDSKQGYRFINGVRAKNVFVNSSIGYIEDFDELDSELYMKKKIMYELKKII